MKKVSLFLFAAFILAGSLSGLAQDAKGAWSVGADVVSSYIWRGSKAGAFSIQPTVKYTSGIFSVGGWGSGDLTTGAPEETDLFAALAFKSGFSLGVTDYHYNTSKLFASKVHAFEANVGYAVGKFSIAGNYIVNTASGTLGDDKYFEAGYQFSTVKLFVGAGDGWYTNDGTFQACNIGITTTKTIKISESFSIPVTGSIIVNPNKEQIFYVIGISL
ncbi:MAG: hypothetical protein WCJ95_12430 [Mariniphaga sp.]